MSVNQRQKGKNVSVGGRLGKVYQWKAKGQCSRGDSCSSRHGDNQRGQPAQSSSLAPRSQRQNDERRPSKGNAPQWKLSIRKERSKDRARIASKEIVRIRRVIIGVLPYDGITNLNQEANSAKSAYSGTLRRTVSPVKKWKKVVGNDQLPF